MLNLSEIEIGQKAEITEFCDPEIKCYSIRFGIEPGQVVKCIARPGGPVVIQRNNQQIAIGENLSEKIMVKVV